MGNEWFKCMRDLTPEEQAAVTEQIRKISKPTGVTLEGILNGETYIPSSQVERELKKLERIQQVVYLDWLNENMSAEDCMAQIEWIIELGDEDGEPADCKND